jgi:hypothetical protein
MEIEFTAGKGLCRFLHTKSPFMRQFDKGGLHKRPFLQHFFSFGVTNIIKVEVHGKTLGTAKTKVKGRASLEG